MILARPQSPTWAALVVLILPLGHADIETEDGAFDPDAIDRDREDCQGTPEIEPLPPLSVRRRTGAQKPCNLGILVSAHENDPDDMNNAASIATTVANVTPPPPNGDDGTGGCSCRVQAPRHGASTGLLVGMVAFFLWSRPRLRR